MWIHIQRVHVGWVADRWERILAASAFSGTRESSFGHVLAGVSRYYLVGRRCRRACAGSFWFSRRRETIPRCPGEITLGPRPRPSVCSFVGPLVRPFTCPSVRPADSAYIHTYTRAHVHQVPSRKAAHAARVMSDVDHQSQVRNTFVGSCAQTVHHPRVVLGSQGIPQYSAARSRACMHTMQPRGLHIARGSLGSELGILLKDRTTVSWILRHAYFSVTHRGGNRTRARG